LQKYTEYLEKYAKIKSCMRKPDIQEYSNLMCNESEKTINIDQSFLVIGKLGEKFVVYSKYSGNKPIQKSEIETSIDENLFDGSAGRDRVIESYNNSPLLAPCDQ
jgi:hypothetical protein